MCNFPEMGAELSSNPSISQGVDHFFDTNFFLHHGDKLPQAIEVAGITNWITETTRLELIQKIGKVEVENRIAPFFHTLRFDDLYERSPEICPVYYYFIICMYRPANLASLDFVDDLFNAKLARGEVLTKEEIGIREKHQKGISKWVQSVTAGGKHSKFLQLMKIRTRTQKKARQAARDLHPAYLNDIRTLSLIIYNALFSKKDVVFHTADSDPSDLLLKWLESISTRMVFFFELAKSCKLNPRVNRNIRRGKAFASSIRYTDLLKKKKDFYTKFLAEYQDEPCVQIAIRRWDQSENKYDDSVYLRFPEDIATWIASIHGQLNCPFTPNNSLHNWVLLNYEWPPKNPKSNQVRFSFRSKTLIEKPARTPADIHRKVCLYCRVDSTGELATWSNFTEPTKSELPKRAI